MAKVEEKKVLYPGREVKVCDGNVTVNVFPLGVRHLIKIEGGIEEIASVVQKAYAARSFMIAARAKLAEQKGIDLNSIPESNDWIVNAIKEAIPVILKEFIGVIADCVTGVDLMDLAHYDLVPVAEAWIEESFGDEKKTKIWKDFIQKKMSGLSGILENVAAGLGQKLNLPEA